MNGRVYDPRLGRFLSPDPVISNPASGQSWNAYSYVLNSPTGRTDPSGLSASCPPSLCAGGGIGGGGGFNTASVAGQGWFGISRLAGFRLAPGLGLNFNFGNFSIGVSTWRDDVGTAGDRSGYGSSLRTLRRAPVFRTTRSAVGLQVPTPEERSPADDAADWSGAALKWTLAVAEWTVPGYDLGVCAIKGGCSAVDWGVAVVGVIPGWGKVGKVAGVADDVIGAAESSAVLVRVAQALINKGIALGRLNRPRDELDVFREVERRQRPRGTSGTGCVGVVQPRCHAGPDELRAGGAGGLRAGGASGSGTARTMPFSNGSSGRGRPWGAGRGITPAPRQAGWRAHSSPILGYSSPTSRFQPSGPWFAAGTRPMVSRVPVASA